MPYQPLCLEVLQCLVVSETLDLQDLLILRATCREFYAELTGNLPGYLKYKMIDGVRYVMIETREEQAADPEFADLFDAPSPDGGLEARQEPAADQVPAYVDALPCPAAGQMAAAG